MNKTACFLCLSVVAVLILLVSAVFPQTTEFTYQGNLTDNALPASGSYDFEFMLYGSLEGGTQIGSTITRTNVPVADGTFAVKLDFGGNFPGDDRYLEIRVTQSAQPGQYTALTPRQKVMTVPYAMKSLASDVAATATDADNLGGVSSGQYVLTTDPRMTDARPPAPDSANYIQNTTTEQTGSNFNISGTGKADKFDTVSQYDIAGNRVLSNAGTSNLFLGNDAGRDNTGNDNTFAGWSAGVQNTTGSYNAYFGANAGLYSNGTSNSFFGSWAGHLNTAGNGNSFFGRESGFNNTDGSRNSFFGRNAGKANTTGAGNTALGYAADFASPDLTFATAIGANAVVSTSNTVQLGRADGSDTVFVPGALNVAGAIAGDLTGNAATATNALTLGGVAADQYVTTAAGNSSYVQNTTSPQAGSNFNISGTGTAAVFRAETQYNLGDAPIMHVFGTDNFFAGPFAGNFTMTGSLNTAIGFNALYHNTTGSFNNAIGITALYYNTTGYSNTASGFAALFSNTTGYKNTAIGYYADVGSGALTYATAIGAGAVVTSSNTVQLGRTDGSDAVFVPGALNVAGTITGTLPAGSVSYIQNTTTQQSASNFNISGTGNASQFNAVTQFNIGGIRVLSVPGTSNTFVGRSAGNSNTGTSNTFVGYLAGQNNSSGPRNSFFGRGAGASNSTTADNSFFGYLAGASNTGTRNSFFGASAGYANTGNFNSFFGGDAGSGNSTGGSNSFFGRNAGRTNTTGSSNTAIGDGADVASGNLQNATAIGAGTIVTASNRIQLGNSGTTVAVYHFGPYVDGEGGRVCFNNQGVLTVCQVSLGQMSSIRPFESGTALITQMSPVLFEEKSSGKASIGLLATEVNEIAPLLINRNGKGDFIGVNYDRLSVLLVNAIKEQQAQIERQQEQIEALKALVCASNPGAAVCK